MSESIQERLRSMQRAQVAAYSGLPVVRHPNVCAEAADYIDNLEKKIEELEFWNRECQMNIGLLEIVKSRYEDALRFYADPKTWEPKGFVDDLAIYEALDDQGDKAREALGEDK